MAVIQVKFLKPFLYSGGTGVNYNSFKVDQKLVQMRGYIEEAVALDLLALGLAATGPTGY